MGLHHLGFVTGNLEATIAFWRDLLGCPLVLSLHEALGPQYFFSLGPGQMIGFFVRPGWTPPAYRKPGAAQAPYPSFDHLALAAPDLNHLHLLQDRLIQAEFPVSEVIDHGFCWSIYSYDPNHIPLEFACPQPGVDLANQPRLADPQAPALAQQGSQPQGPPWPSQPDPSPRLVLPGLGADLFGKAPGSR